LNLQAKLDTEIGRELVRIIDPYSYREKITIPKLLINGANDRYWTIDALSVYWQGLQKPKAVLYAPNAGHDLKDAISVIGTSSAFFHAVASGQSFPNLNWQYDEGENQLFLRIESSEKPSQGRIWYALSSTKNFSDSTWKSLPMQLDGKKLIGKIEKPKSGNIAFWGEVSYQLKIGNFNLSTSPKIHTMASE